MPARLVPLSDTDGAPVPLQRPVILIGRHSECDVRLDLPQVSRRHCCIALAYDRLIIRDLGSHNGIWVNGERVDEARLLHGDEIAIGPTIYQVQDMAVVRNEPTTANPTPPEPAPNPAASPAPAFSEVNAATNDQDAELIPLDDLYPSF
jgi:pSer/pThr/pTyr-binding forkhead associated (FHA) protein